MKGEEYGSRLAGLWTKCGKWYDDKRFFFPKRINACEKNYMTELPISISGNISTSHVVRRDIFCKEIEKIMLFYVRAGHSSYRIWYFQV